MSSVWLTIKDCPNYSVSSWGEVRRDAPSSRCAEPRLMRPWFTHGYPMVSLYQNGIRKRVAVHRLVAEAFWGKPEGMEVNHINGIRSDNRLSNLEWVTHEQNAIHAAQNGFLFRRLTKEQIEEIKSLRTRKPIRGVRQIARQFGVHHAHIMAIWRDDNYGENAP